MADFQDGDYGDYGGYGPGPGPPNPYGAPPSDVYDQDRAREYDHASGGPASMRGQYMDQGGQDDARSMQSGGGSRTDEQYKQYTEQNKQSGRPGCIDTENGIAPRRCTDCICLFVFIVYVLGMCILVTVAKTRVVGSKQWGDVRRLTHGHDYNGRLCGVDPGVEDKAFLFWCRAEPGNRGKPIGLNLDFPTCVESCPYNSTADIPCLFPHSTVQTSIHGGVMGTVETYHVQFQQSIALTAGYNTMPFGGRFCLPTNSTLRASVMSGPLFYSRPRLMVGSLQDPWGVVFQACLLAVALGYLFLFIIKAVPKTFVIVVLYLTWFLLVAAGGFFLYAIIGLIGEKTNNEAILETTKFASYMSYNPLYDKYMPDVATLLSVGIAAVIWLLSCSVVGIITHVAGSGFDYVPDLVDAASECWGSMQAMLIPPAVEALMKFFLTWILSYNFMYLASVGWYDDRRLQINGQTYRDEASLFHFDWWVLPWMVYYLFGWVWIMELTTAFGQFLISFSVISWYFIKKEGVRKVEGPALAPFFASVDGAFYHVGSLCLGAAIIPWTRLIRTFNWVEDEIVPNEEAQCCAGEGCLGACINKICQCIGSCCSIVTRTRKKCQPACCSTAPQTTTEGKNILLSTGCSYRYMKNAYNDVIIRSQHFLQASQRSFLLINRYDSTKNYLLGGKGCQVVTVVGVVSIGVICMIYTYLVIMNVPSFRDPTGSSFIAEPMMISVMVFFLTSGIGYSFMALFDHTAETLLYCYAWNKKFHKDSNGAPVDDYLPESLRDLVDADIDVDEGYCFYGQAKPEMYLHTWMPKRKQLKADKLTAKERQQGAMSTIGTNSRTGAGATGTNISQFSYGQGGGSPYQPVPNGPPYQEAGFSGQQGGCGGYSPQQGGFSPSGYPQGGGAFTRSGEHW